VQITVPKMVLITDPTPCPGVPWSAEWDTRLPPQPVSAQRLQAGVSSLVAVGVFHRLHAFCSAHATFSPASRADLGALLTDLMGEAAGLDLTAAGAVATGPSAAHSAAPGTVGPHSAVAGKIARQRSSDTRSSGRSSRSGRGENSHSGGSGPQARAASRVPPHAGAWASSAASAADPSSASSSPEGEEAALETTREWCASPSKRARRSSAGAAAARVGVPGAAEAGAAKAGAAVASVPLTHSTGGVGCASATGSVVTTTTALRALRLNSSSKGFASTRTVASTSGCGSKRSLSRALTYSGGCSGASSDAMRAGDHAASTAAPKGALSSGESSHGPAAPPGASERGDVRTSRAAAAPSAGTPARPVTAGVPEFRSLAAMAARAGSDEVRPLLVSASALTAPGAAAAATSFNISAWLTRDAWSNLEDEADLAADDPLLVAPFGLAVAPQVTRASGSLANSSGALDTSYSGAAPRLASQAPISTSAAGAGATCATSSAANSLARHSPALVAATAGLAAPSLRFEAVVSPIPFIEASSRTMSAALPAASWFASPASAFATAGADRDNGAGCTAGDASHSPFSRHAGARASRQDAAAGEQPTSAAQIQGGAVATAAAHHVAHGFAFALPTADAAVTNGPVVVVSEGANSSFELEAAAAAHFAAGGCSSAAVARVSPGSHAAAAVSTTGSTGAGASGVLAPPTLLAVPLAQPGRRRDDGSDSGPPRQVGTALTLQATVSVANSAPAPSTSKLSRPPLSPAAEER
jgi:hypothetical protein